MEIETRYLTKSLESRIDSTQSSLGTRSLVVRPQRRGIRSAISKAEGVSMVSIVQEEVMEDLDRMVGEVQVVAAEAHLAIIIEAEALML